MNSEDRRLAILETIRESHNPIKGLKLGQKFNVSRQIIVQDIALLRAGGEDIIATPQGYMILKPSGSNDIKAVIACRHDISEMEEELMTIVDCGGIILDVTVEHEVYGEFKADLMIESPRDVRNFIIEMNKKDEKPLSYLSDGVHLHTIRVKDKQTLNEIEEALMNKGFLLKND